MNEGKQGLWANIHAKRKRIKNGSGERMRKPGEKGAPTAADFKAAQNEEVDNLLEYPEDLQKMKKSDSYKVGDKIWTKVGGKWHKGHITTPLNKAGNHGVKFQHGGKTHSYVSSPNELRLHVEELDVQDTDDYKITKSGRKVKAHRIVFNKGEDDGKKGVTEQMKKSYKDFVEQHTPDLTEEQKNELVAELQEVLGKDDPAGKWISDFVHSDNPKFKGKSKEKRKQMALAAYYAKQRNEQGVAENFGPGYAPQRRNNPSPGGFERGDQWVPPKSPKKKKEQGGNQHKLDKNKNGKLDAEDFKKLRKEELEQFEEDYTELLEAFDPDHYQASHEKSKFKDGYRAVLKHKETGREVYVGSTAYKSKEHAEGEAETYKKHYSVGSGKATPGANYRHDRAVSDYRKKAKEAGHIAEGWDDMLAASKKRAEAGKTSTMTKHDVKKTSTGTVYTKQRDADGMSKEFKRDNEPAQKRGRGRPKKSSFGEAVEFLMNLDEETFDSFMEEGFDTFMEHYEQLDELSKATLGSYAKKAAVDAKFKGYQAGHVEGGEMARAKRYGGGSGAGSDIDDKAHKRLSGVKKAIDRLTK